MLACEMVPERVIMLSKSEARHAISPPPLLLGRVCCVLADADAAKAHGRPHHIAYAVFICAFSSFLCDIFLLSQGNVKDPGYGSMHAEQMMAEELLDDDVDACHEDVRLLLSKFTRKRMPYVTIIMQLIFSFDISLISFFNYIYIFFTVSICFA